jgi:hypothetical protein
MDTTLIKQIPSNLIATPPHFLEKFSPPPSSYLFIHMPPIDWLIEIGLFE